jgi:hypothetical protein
MRSKYWLIEEDVGHGLFAVLPGLYETRHEALEMIRREAHSKGLRPALYELGAHNGPERIEAMERS